MKKEISMNVYSTSEYESFRILEGNRSIEKSRVSKIRKSIEETGWIHNPIVVNEKNEIIDGQGRFTALKQLCMPIEFVVHEGAGIKECISMNIKQKNWSAVDFCESYARQGYRSYILLNNACSITPSIPVGVVAGITKKKILRGGELSSLLINGSFYMDDEEYNYYSEISDFATFAYKTIKKHQGYDSRLTLSALCYCYGLESTNKDRFLEIVATKLDLIQPLNTQDGILKSISRVYNKNLSKESKMSFDALYTLSIN